MTHNTPHSPGTPDGETRRPSDDLFDRLYEELRNIARFQMSRLKPGQTLQATALVHEAFIKLAATHWTSEKEFFVTAAKAMRSIVLDEVKSKNTIKRGGAVSTITLSGVDPADGRIQSPEEILSFDEVVKRLERLDPELRELLLLRHYAGLPLTKIAAICDVPLRTLERRWRLIRAMVMQEKERHSGGPDS